MSQTLPIVIVSTSSQEAQGASATTLQPADPVTTEATDDGANEEILARLTPSRRPTRTPSASRTSGPRRLAPVSGARSDAASSRSRVRALISEVATASRRAPSMAAATVERVLEQREERGRA